MSSVVTDSMILPLYIPLRSNKTLTQNKEKPALYQQSIMSHFYPFAVNHRSCFIAIFKNGQNAYETRAHWTLYSRVIHCKINFIYSSNFSHLICYIIDIPLKE